MDFPTIQKGYADQRDNMMKVLGSMNVEIEKLNEIEDLENFPCEDFEVLVTEMEKNLADLKEVNKKGEYLRNRYVARKRVMELLEDLKKINRDDYFSEEISSLVSLQYKILD